MKLSRMGLILVFLVLSACKPPEYSPDNSYRQENVFPLPKELKGSGAFLVLEWNGRTPQILASGSLIDKKNGLIRTAKHFTDAFGQGGVNYCRVFLMNGKVYKAVLARVPPIRDAALIELVPPFFPDELPEPLPAAKKMPAVGDKIFIRGFHPHPYQVREGNKEEGFPDREINIFKTYYGRAVTDLSQESEVVFDNLEAVVVKPDPEAVRRLPWLTDLEKRAALEYENDHYIKVVTVRDHKFSFGGLSGGLAVNQDEEVFGVITAQDPFKFEVDDHGFFIFPEIQLKVIKQQFWDTIYITPIDSITDLDDYVQKRLPLK